ncbi:MAG: porin, partial [Rhizobiaceae bacterium]|nr:porin [Rhizobiaceae bacterium]
SAQVAEPMDYVKVCDTDGNGFFYIPGTETCLKFSGYVRSEYIYTDVPDTVVPASFRLDPTTGLIVAVPASVRSGTTGDWRFRTRLNIDARNETDWGTLRSQLRLQSDGRSTGANAVINRALISLGGFRLGYSDSFFTTHHGYGWQYAANDGYYDDDQAIFLDYTYSANGFSATIGVQDSNSVAAVSTAADPYDAYFGASYAGSWGRVAGTAIYDSSVNELAWKVSADITAIENVGIHAWYSGDNGATQYVTGYTAATVEWQWGVDVSYKVSSQFTVWAGYTDADGVDMGRLGLGARWNPVSGLSIRPEVLFGEGDYVQARLRVVRSF